MANCRIGFHSEDAGTRPDAKPGAHSVGAEALPTHFQHGSGAFPPAGVFVYPKSNPTLQSAETIPFTHPPVRPRAVQGPLAQGKLLAAE